MLQFKAILLLLVSLFISCVHKRKDKDAFDSKTNQTDFNIYGNFKICDTCKTVVSVTHSNCLFFNEVNVESGTISIPNHIVDSFKNSLLNDSISRLRATVDSVFDFQSGGYVKNQVLLNTSKLYLKNFSNFKFQESDGYFRIFELDGKVTEIKRNEFEDGSKDSTYSVWLSVDTIIKTDKIKICGN